MVSTKDLVGNCYESCATRATIGLVCANYQTDTRPHFCSLSPVLLSTKSEDNLGRFLDGRLWGKRRAFSNEKLTLEARPSLRRLWLEYPWNALSHYDVGIFQIVIPARKWKAISASFPLVTQLDVDRALISASCNGIYIDTQEYLMEFLLNLGERLEQFSLEQLPLRMFLPGTSSGAENR
jgi:hypothetical protein